MTRFAGANMGFVLISKQQELQQGHSEAWFLANWANGTDLGLEWAGLAVSQDTPSGISLPAAQALWSPVQEFSLTNPAATAYQTWVAALSGSQVSLTTLTLSFYSIIILMFQFISEGLGRGGG